MGAKEDMDLSMASGSVETARWTLSTRVISILSGAAPIAIGLLSTQLMVLVDLAMVGQLGEVALGAVGLSMVCHMLVLSFFVGIGPSVQGIVAGLGVRGITAGRVAVLAGGIVLALALGIPVAVVGYFVAPDLLGMLTPDAEVIESGVPYLRALLCAVVGLGVADAMQGFWTGISRARVYMLAAVVMNLVNVSLNYLLIFGHYGFPELGTTGAGLASLTSVYVGVLTYLIYLLVNCNYGSPPRVGSLIRHCRAISRNMAPIATQQLFFAAGSMVLFWIYAQMGTTELAAATVLVRVTFILLIVAAAVGQCSTTFVSSALGVRDIRAAVTWGWSAAATGLITITAFGLPMLILPQQFLSLFLTDSAAIFLGKLPLQLTAASTGVVALSYVLATILNSIGDGGRVMVASVSLRWLIFIPLAWWMGVHLDLGLLKIWLAQIIYGLILTAIMVGFWRDRRWIPVHQI